MTVRRPTMAALIALVALAGCTADPGPADRATGEPAPQPTGTPAPQPTGTPGPDPTGTPAPEPGDPAPTLDAADAVPAVEGVDYEVVVTWPGGSLEAGGVRPWVLLPDGSAIGVQEPPDHLVGDVFEAPSRVGVMSGDDFTPFGDTSGVLPERGFRGVGAVAHADGVTVWTESHSIQGWGAWRLFVHDDAGTRLLTTEEDLAARFPDLTDGGGWHLDVHDGRVSWPNDGSEVSVSLDGTDLRLDPLPDAAAPADAEVVTRDDGEQALVTSGPLGQVLVDGVGPHVLETVSCGDAVAWTQAETTTDDTATLLLLTRDEASLHRIDGVDRWGTLQCTGDLLMFSVPAPDPDPTRHPSTTVIRRLG